ncbi:MAG: glycosyltransferase [Saprospiraceae bacterium]
MTHKTHNIPGLPPVVCVGFPRWEGSDYLSSTVQLMQALSAYTPVLYVDYPFTWKDVWQARRQHRKDIPVAAILDNEQRLQTNVMPHGGQVHLLRLRPFVPANFFKKDSWYDAVTAWNARRAIPVIQQAIRQLGWVAPVVINAFNPALGRYLAGKLGESRLVYYCYDEIGAAPWIGRHGSRHEVLFLPKVDEVVVTSKGLLAAKSALNEQCTLVRNGVDLRLFQQKGPRPDDVPSGKVVGYIGSVDSRLDTLLLEKLAHALPYVSFVFVGRIMEERSRALLAALPNVRLLGSRPPAQLGSYLGAFDVGLIPFAYTPLTAGIYPLKVNEYLSQGIPVVSTRFADMSDFEQVCTVVDDHEAFIRAVMAYLEQDMPDARTARKAFAAANTWEARAKELLAVLVNEPQVVAP